MEVEAQPESLKGRDGRESEMGESWYLIFGTHRKSEAFLLIKPNSYNLHLEYRFVLYSFLQLR